MTDKTHIVELLAKKWLVAEHVPPHLHEVVMEFAIWTDKFINDDFLEEGEGN